MIAMVITSVLFLGAAEVPARFEMPFEADSPQKAHRWQEKVRARLLSIAGAQNRKTKAPLKIRIGDFRDGGGFRVADVRFQGNEHQTIEATLTVPEGKGPFPAVICLHGHSGNREMVHDASTIYHGFASEYARRGLVTLAPTLEHCKYASNQLWNLMRLVDVLEKQPFVDKNRIGVAGLSMGGEWSMWLAACDTRIKAAVVSGWMCTTEGVLRVPNCVCWEPPGLLELCDICEVHILIAPHSLLFESAIGDNCFPVDATKTGFQKVLHGYEVMGAGDCVRHHVFPGVHEWNGAQAYDFLLNALRR